MPVATAVFFFLVLMIFYSGHLYSSDTQTKIESARNFLTRGTFAIDMSTGAWGVSGRGGAVYPHFSIGSILAVMPAALAGIVIAPITGAQLATRVTGSMVVLTNVAITAIFGAVLFWLYRRWKLSARRALAFSAAVIFASQLWPYSSTGWSEPLALLLGLAAFACIAFIQSDTTPRSSWVRWIFWGACAGAASLIRIEYTLFFLIFACVWSLREKRRVSNVFAGCAIIGLISLAHPLFNYLRFGASADFGYFASGDTHTAVDAVRNAIHYAGDIIISRETLKHAYWFFLSFGKNHWFWVSPLLALSLTIPWQWPKLPSNVRTLFLTAAMFTPLYIFLINTAEWCCTTWCWGYRYFLVTFPFLLLPLAFTVWERRWTRIVFVCLAGVGVGISFFAAVVNFHVALERLAAQYGYEQTMWGRTASFAGAPFWEHVRMFPEQLRNTFALLTGSVISGDWEVLRITCLDIWPVGAVAQGAPAWLSFGAWGALVAITAAFYWIVLHPRMVDSH